MNPRTNPLSGGSYRRLANGELIREDAAPATPVADVPAPADHSAPSDTASASAPRRRKHNED